MDKGQCFSQVGILLKGRASRESWTRLRPLAKILSLNNLCISVSINLVSAQSEGATAQKKIFQRNY